MSEDPEWKYERERGARIAIERLQQLRGGDIEQEYIENAVQHAKKSELKWIPFDQTSL